METHAHVHHTPGKKIWHYFYEFLMLFLAVFCGFLAENQREHMVNHHREKEYMGSMLDDLKSDTVLLDYAVKYWNNINKSVDSLAEALNIPLSAGDLTRAYRHLNNAMDYFSFTYNDRTISQLKNAGGFLLLRKKNVSNKIIAYDQFNNDAIRNIASQHNKFFENVTVLRNKIFSQNVLNKIYEKYLYVPPPPSSGLWIDSLISKNKSPFPLESQSLLIFEFKNALLAYKKDYTNMQWGYDQLLTRQRDLIKLIGEEYHLDAE